MCFKILFFCISTPENVYLDKSISILGGLEAEILTRVVCGLGRPFLKWPPLESVFFWSPKNILFVTSGLQNIHVDIDIQNICGLEADITIRDTYHICGQPFCKMAATKVIKMLCVGIMCITILYLVVVPLKMYI